MESISFERANFPVKQILVLIVVVVGILLVSQSLIPMVSAGEDGWETHETEHFVIEYQPGYEEDVEYIGGVAENAREELLETFPEDVSELDFDQPVHIRVYPGDMWSASDWALHWSDSTPVTIHVQAESDSPAGDEWYEHALAHEQANMFLWNDAGQYDVYQYYTRNPSWFHQGLSEYYVYQTPTVNPQFPPSFIEDLNESIKAGAGTFATISDDMYHGGHLISIYMIDVYGEQAVWDVLRSPEQQFHKAVEDGLVVSLQTFEMEWHRWAEENIGGNYSQMYNPNIIELENQLSEAEDRIDELEDKLVERDEKLADANETIAELEEELNQTNTTPTPTPSSEAPTPTPSSEDAIPGPGLIGAVISLIGVGYLIRRWSEIREMSEQ